MLHTSEAVSITQDIECPSGGTVRGSSGLYFTGKGEFVVCLTLSKMLLTQSSKRNRQHFFVIGSFHLSGT